jgi:hypothetical protein
MVFNRKEYYKEYYKRKKEKYREYIDKWQKKNQDKIKEYRKEYNKRKEVREKSKLRNYNRYHSDIKRREYILNWKRQKRKDPKYLEKQRIYQRELNRKLKLYTPYTLKNKLRVKKWKENNKNKFKAQQLAERRIKIIFPFCLYCGSNKKLHRHHEDYDRPLNVLILCNDCHKKIHRKYPSKEFL